MKKVLLVIALLFALPARASAQGGMNLFWDECASGGGATTKSFACDANDGQPFTLVVSVVAPAALPQFAALLARIDFCMSGGDIPPWWQLEAGQCRVGAVRPSFDPALNPTSCADIWHGTPNVEVYAVYEQTLGAHVVRLNGAAAVAQGSELAIPADGAELYACRITIDRSKTVGAGSCAGCATASFIALQECQLEQPAGVGDYTITWPAAGQTVTWNGASVPDCYYIPAVNRSWGSIKSLYR